MHARASRPILGTVRFCKRVHAFAKAGAEGRSVNWERECDETVEEAFAVREEDSNGTTEVQNLEDPELTAMGKELVELRDHVRELQKAVDISNSMSLAPADLGGSADEYSLDELYALRSQVDRLKAMVFKQREIIRQLRATSTSLSFSQDFGRGAERRRSRGDGRSNSAAAAAVATEEARRVQRPGPHMPISDRRLLGGFDARFHSTSAGATPKDFRVLPARIVLVRHGESYEDDLQFIYSRVPDPRIPLTELGREQAREAGRKIRAELSHAHGGRPYRVFFYTSPYLRSSQTFQCITEAMFETPLQPGEGQASFAGMREEVQLREQDFGNFQDPQVKMRKRNERKRFGRFFYRFPNGESGADLYDRITIFQDHLIRDINAGRFSQDTDLVLVTHGLALRMFLMRWFHWRVDQLLAVENPTHAEPLVLARIPSEEESRPDGPVAWMHTKSLYQLTNRSMSLLKGCTESMCSSGTPFFRPKRAQDS
eukprot:CAMPEP_0177581252 /NCGR_PEP_ID=MMETSP0419_2-20121207/2042_1 /TAXON_ID=582737 /ORGANISM="Tetraselmis sp., Strain GSL018" /LENGTH=484 /DNA_ID=CAMNT_0019070269 /DNA_START=214 /DNA_END=1668 /DNA_ORIENTATION=-